MHQPAQTMIESQLRPRGITDERVLDALGGIPRESFVPAALKEDAYSDSPLPIGDGQTISQPYMVAVMSQLLMLRGRERVLEVGTGSGYQTAVLSALCRRVYTVEFHAALSARARLVLQSLGCRNIEYRVGDGTAGWPEEAPFDRIMVTAAARDVPPELFGQLKEEGRMVIPLGSRFMQELTVVINRKGRPVREVHEPCVFVPLAGRYSPE